MIGNDFTDWEIKCRWWLRIHGLAGPHSIGSADLIAVRLNCQFLDQFFIFVTIFVTVFYTIFVTIFDTIFVTVFYTIFVTVFVTIFQISFFSVGTFFY